MTQKSSLCSLCSPFSLMNATGNLLAAQAAGNSAAPASSAWNPHRLFAGAAASPN
jgi:hypothetical protein